MFGRQSSILQTKLRQSSRSIPMRHTYKCAPTTRFLHRPVTLTLYRCSPGSIASPSKYRPMHYPSDTSRKLAMHGPSWPCILQPPTSISPFAGHMHVCLTLVTGAKLAVPLQRPVSARSLAIFALLIWRAGRQSHACAQRWTCVQQMGSGWRRFRSAWSASTQLSPLPVKLKECGYALQLHFADPL